MLKPQTTSFPNLRGKRMERDHLPPIRDMPEEVSVDKLPTPIQNQLNAMIRAVKKLQNLTQGE